jgi:hypothetical protein
MVAPLEMALDTVYSSGEFGSIPDLAEDIIKDADQNVMISTKSNF